MNEEKITQLAVAIEVAIAEEIEQHFDGDSVERIVENVVESEIQELQDAIDNLADAISSQIAKEFSFENLIQNSEFVFVIKEKLMESLAKDAQPDSEQELRYIASPNGMWYNGSQPTNVSALIDAIICLTADDATVMQFFNRIALLREFALNIKNK